MTQANVEIVQQAYGFFQTGDLPALLGRMDPNVEWQLFEIPNVRISGTRHGRDQVELCAYAQIGEEVHGVFRRWAPSPFRCA